MKKFLKEAGIFLSLLLILATLSYHFNQYLFETDKVEIDEKFTTLICGSSISARGLDPSIIENSFNMSRSGRTTLDVFKILEKVLPNNRHIKNVTIDFSPQGLSRRMEYFYYIPGFTQNRMKGMYPLLNYQDLAGYYVNKQIYLKSFMRYECVPNFFYLKRKMEWTEDQPPYFGKFLKENRSFVQQEDEKVEVEKLFMFEEKDGMINRNGHPNLDSIIQLTKRLDMDLWLFSGPLHKRLRKLIPTEIQTEFEKESQFALEFDHVHYLNYVDYSLPDSCFRNLNHINYYGSQVISPLVNAEIEKFK